LVCHFRTYTNHPVMYSHLFLTPSSLRWPVWDKIHSTASRLLLLLFVLMLPLAASATTFPVTTTSDSGPGSLREAIGLANATAGADDITFSTSGTLVLASSLPTITDALTITGTTSFLINGGTNRVFEVEDVNNLVLTGLDLSLGTGGAINISGTNTNITIDGNNFSGNSNVLFARNITGLTITNNNFSNTGHSNNLALFLQNVSGLLAHTNNFMGVEDGIRLQDMDNISIDSVAGANIVIKDTDNFSAVELSFVFQRINGLALSNLDMSGGSDDAIYIYGPSTDFTIENCNISNRRRAIVAREIDGFTVTNNNLSNSGQNNFFSLDLDNISSLTAHTNNFMGAGGGISLKNMSNIDVDNVAGTDTEIVIASTDNFSNLDIAFQLSNMTNSSIRNLDLSNGSGQGITLGSGELK